MTDVLAPSVGKLAACIRVLASDKDGDVITAARGLVRMLKGAGTDIHAFAERIAKPNGGLTDAEMRKLYDAGYEAGVEADDLDLGGAQSFTEVLILFTRGFDLGDVCLRLLQFALILRSVALGFSGLLLFLCRLVAPLGVGPHLDVRNFLTPFEIAADSRNGLVVRLDLLADLSVGRLGGLLQQPRDQFSLLLGREVPPVKVKRVDVL